MAGYTCRFGHVYAPDGERLDECVATVFAAPHSFTGEDVVELSCHGGLFVLKAVLQAVFAAGAVSAAPGEFTRRAFLNGKMDLAQAEAVMQIISAQGREAMKAAQAGHDGALSRRIEKLRSDLTDIGAHLAAWADYPDDDIPQVDETMLKTRLAAGKTALKDLLAGFDGRAHSARGCGDGHCRPPERRQIHADEPACGLRAFHCDRSCGHDA